MCTQATLDVYITEGSCSINDVLFNSFDFNSVATGLAVAPDASAVLVVPIVDDTNPGFRFVGPFGVGTNSNGTGQSLATLISYIATDTAGSNITAASLGLVAGSVGSGSAQATESVCGGTFDISHNCSGQLLSLTGNPSQLFATDNFAGGVSTVSIRKSFFISSGTHLGSTAGIGEMVNTLTLGGGGGGGVPEPDSALTLGSGLIITSLLLRRRIRRA
jgi:hypothetical protein